ncbi:DinB family protein [Myxococcus stipitatus]|uniref:DinB family protein n=1 Tax=Myxococcus stipitatus TaxID=83455 RepID=UPI002278DB97|nr:DinB family protein [Myxococcus stipitatus]
MNLQASMVSGDVSLSSTPLELLVTHCAWANRQLFSALRAVEAFESQKGADLIMRALDHIHVVRSVFQAHLQGVSHGFTAPQRAVIPSFQELDLEFEILDRWYVETVASLRPEELARPREVRFTDGKVVTMTPAAMLLHVVLHTTHHRGNVDVIMLQTGMPRRRDGVPEFLLSRASAT